MIKIKENEYQMEEQDFIEYLNTLELEEKINTQCTHNWLTARIVRKFCEENEIVIEEFHAYYTSVKVFNTEGLFIFKSPKFFYDYYCRDRDKYLIHWLRSEYKQTRIFTIEQILSYFNQKTTQKLCQ